MNHVAGILDFRSAGVAVRSTTCLKKEQQRHEPRSRNYENGEFTQQTCY
ncbi:hypothetical protein QUB32_28640 [Microcoleus sp. AT8-A4]